MRHRQKYKVHQLLTPFVSPVRLKEAPPVTPQYLKPQEPYSDAISGFVKTQEPSHVVQQSWTKPRRRRGTCGGSFIRLDTQRVLVASLEACQNRDMPDRDILETCQTIKRHARQTKETCQTD